MKYCGVFKEGYYCKREPGHNGNHESYSDTGKLLQSWRQESPFVECGEARPTDGTICRRKTGHEGPHKNCIGITWEEPCNDLHLVPDPKGINPFARYTCVLSKGHEGHHTSVNGYCSWPPKTPRCSSRFAEHGLQCEGKEGHPAPHHHGDRDKPGGPYAVWSGPEPFPQCSNFSPTLGKRCELVAGHKQNHKAGEFNSWVNFDYGAYCDTSKDEVIGRWGREVAELQSDKNELYKQLDLQRQETLRLLGECEVLKTELAQQRNEYHDLEGYLRSAYEQRNRAQDETKIGASRIDYYKDLYVKAIATNKEQSLSIIGKLRAFIVERAEAKKVGKALDDFEAAVREDKPWPYA